MENILTIISLIALLVGIVGKTWDEKKKGLNRLTSTGRLTVTIGLIVCGISIFKNVQNQNEIDWQNEQKLKIRKIADKEIAIAIRHLTNPFQVSRFDTTASALFKKLSDTTFLAELGKINLKTDSNNFYPHIYNWEHFSEAADRGRLALNAVIDKYAIYMDAETILNIEEILNDEFFQHRFLGIKILVDANDYLEKYPLADAWFPNFRNARQHDFHDCLLFMDKLKQLADKINMESTKWY